MKQMQGTNFGQSQEFLPVQRKTEDEEDQLTGELWELYEPLFLAELGDRDPSFPNKGRVWHMRVRDGECRTFNILLRYVESTNFPKPRQLGTSS